MRPSIVGETREPEPEARIVIEVTALALPPILLDLKKDGS
jgi:hypothetical protein